MWSSVNSSDRLSGASSARDSSDTVTPPSVAVRRRPGSRRQLPKSSTQLILLLTVAPRRRSHLLKGSPNFAKRSALRLGGSEAHSSAESRMTALPATLASVAASRAVAICSLGSLPNAARRRLTQRWWRTPWLESCTEGKPARRGKRPLNQRFRFESGASVTAALKSW